MILLYEAALGLGLSVGPLLGALLGSFSWRGPFLGTAILMAAALILCATFLAKDSHLERPRISVLDPLKALRNPVLLRTSIGAALYTAAFFTVLAWSPFVLRWGAVEIGLIFFGWGVCVAVSSVFLAPRLAERVGEKSAIIGSVLAFAVLMLLMAVPGKPLLVVAVIVSGLVSGLLNTLFTGAAMSVSDAPRPVASAGYNFLRWLGGALAATFVSHLAQPFVVAAVLCVVAAGLLTLNRTDTRDVPSEAVLAGEQLVG